MMTLKMYKIWKRLSDVNRLLRWRESISETALKLNNGYFSKVSRNVESEKHINKLFGTLFN